MELLAVPAYAAVGAVHAGVYFYRREVMKQRDEEIGEEREREREREEEEGRERRPRKSTLKHFLHSHPIYEVYCSTAVQCHACDTRVLSWAYSCTDGCKFFLHEVCAKNPVTLSPCMYSLSEHMPSTVVEARTITTFAHKDHPVKEIFSNVDYKCEQCFTPGCGKRFRCGSCVVDLHPICATCPTRVSSYMHPAHELKLKTKRHFKDCAICGRDMGPNVRLYRCKACEFYVHPACSQLPRYLLHDLHPLPHPLQLKPATSSRSCDARCGKQCGEGSWCYECKICDVSFHVACVLKRSIHGGTEKVQIDDIIQPLTATQEVLETAHDVITVLQ